MMSLGPMLACLAGEVFHKAFLSLIFTFSILVQNSMAVTCNYVSSGLWTQTGITSGDGMTEVYTFGSATVNAGESSCVRIGQTEYSVEPYVVIFRPHAVQGGTAMCQAMVSSTMNALCSRNGEFYPGTRNEQSCMSRGNQQSEAYKSLCDGASLAAKLTVQDCGKDNYLLASWTDTCSVSTMGCHPVGGAWPVQRSYFCLDSLSRYLVESVTYPVETVGARYFVNGVETGPSPEFRAQLTSHQNSLFDRTYIVTRAANSEKFYRASPISLGDKADLCALTVHNATGRLSSNFAITKEGHCPIGVRGSWPTFNKGTTLTPLPFLDRTSGCTMSRNKLECPVKTSVIIQVIIKNNMNLTGLYTDCNLESLSYTMEQNECPLPNFLIVKGICRPIIASPDCQIQITKISTDEVIYSVVNYQSTSCTMNISGSKSNVVKVFPLEGKYCYQNPNTPYSPKVSENKGKTEKEPIKWKLPTFGTLLGILIIGLVIVAVLCLCGKISCPVMKRVQEVPYFAQQVPMPLLQQQTPAQTVSSPCVNVNFNSCDMRKELRSKSGREEGKPGKPDEVSFRREDTEAQSLASYSFGGSQI